MKAGIAIASVVFWALLQPVHAGEEIQPTKPRWKQWSFAYGFLQGQNLSLQIISTNQPDLAKEASNASIAFQMSAFGESEAALTQELSALLKQDWSNYKSNLIAQLQANLRKQRFSQTDASNFIAEVHARAKGQLPEEVRATLLSVNPRFTKKPELEMVEGYKQAYRTKDHPKAKGIDFSTDLPASWARREGNRPNIIQVFHSANGNGPAQCMFMVKPLLGASTLTKKDLKEMFQPSELKDMMPENAKFISAQPIVLESLPAGMLVCDQTLQRLDLTVTMRMTQIMTVHQAKEAMILLQLLVAVPPGGTNSLDELQTQFLPTFKLIANSLVIRDLYK